jgi:retinol dehydrogenase 12
MFEIPSQKGRVILITGANTGIGRATAEAMARRGAEVWLACRSEEKTKPVLDGIRASGGTAELLQLDLADLASVRDAARSFLAKGRPLHVLVNNAGLAAVPGTTKDGFEMTFGTNHLGHFLLTELLMARLRESAPARIVNVSSASHYRAKGVPFDRLREPLRGIGTPEYAVSKLCNVLFTKELARGRAGKAVTSYAVHPGAVASDIWRRVPGIVRPLLTMFMKSNEEGAQTSLYCACSFDVADDDGLYYENCRSVSPSRLARDAELGRRLWERSDEWTRAFH